MDISQPGVYTEHVFTDPLGVQIPEDLSPVYQSRYARGSGLRKPEKCSHKKNQNHLKQPWHSHYVSISLSFHCICSGSPPHTHTQKRKNTQKSLPISTVVKTFLVIFSSDRICIFISIQAVTVPFSSQALLSLQPYLAVKFTV